MFLNIFFLFFLLPRTLSVSRLLTQFCCKIWSFRIEAMRDALLSCYRLCVCGRRVPPSQTPTVGERERAWKCCAARRLATKNTPHGNSSSIKQWISAHAVKPPGGRCGVEQTGSFSLLAGCRITKQGGCDFNPCFTGATQVVCQAFWLRFQFKDEAQHFALYCAAVVKFILYHIANSKWPLKGQDSVASNAEKADCEQR